LARLPGLLETANCRCFHESKYGPKFSSTTLPSSSAVNVLGAGCLFPASITEAMSMAASNSLTDLGSLRSVDLQIINDEEQIFLEIASRREHLVGDIGLEVAV
jgi:hypothetical protein